MHILIPALHRPLRPTGVCRHAANLANCLIDTARVDQVTLLVGAWQKSYFSTLLPKNAEKINLQYVDIKNSSLSRNFWFLLGLPKLANSLRPDIVHMSFPLPFIRSRFDAPVVSTIHDLYPYEFPENFGKARATFNKLFLKQSIAGSDGLCCVSQMTKAALEHYFDRISSRKKVSVVYNYVDFSDVSPRIPKSFEADPQVPFLMSVAQHRKNKNLDWLIQAYSSRLRTKQISETTQLVIVGSTGPESDNLETLVRTLHLQDKVRFLSALDDSELCWLYQNSQLFVIPSSTEGFCLPLVEALASGCRVVCSDIPIFREVGSSACTFFDLENQPIKKLETAIGEAMASSHTKDSSVDKQFSKSHVAEQLLNFYTALTPTD
ncbi:MAG: glycosyltransferase family 1 protein [Cyanobacteria bacterium P01_D01_bin.1]